MAAIRLTKTRLVAGVWEGVLTGADGTPSLMVTHLNNPLGGVSVEPLPEPGHWDVRVSIPSELIADGVQTLVISERGTGARLAHFAIIAGEPLSDDLRAEIDLLRAELDMLKSAFRRHCVETSSGG
jgi:hypothetical protein